MIPDNLLEGLAVKHISLRRSGNRLLVKDPDRQLTPALKQMIARHKTALLMRVDKQSAAPAPDGCPGLRVEALPADYAREMLFWRLLHNKITIEFYAADAALCAALEREDIAAIGMAQVRFNHALSDARALARDIQGAAGVADPDSASSEATMTAQPDLIVDNIPAELKALRQWVVWKYKSLPSGKTTKPPYQPAGYFAKSNEPRTWSTFGAALKAVSRFDGIGLCFGADVCGIDLDNCLDDARALKPWAADLLNRLAVPTYTEISPSARGLHLLYFGEFPAELRGRSFDLGSHEGVAFYAFPSNRYFTMTGQRFGSVTTVARLQADDFASLADYIRETFPQKNKPQAQSVPQVQMNHGDDDILQSMSSAKNAGKVQALLQGDISGYPSASEADLALCTIIAHYTTDPTQIDRIFRGSGLFRDKWDMRRGVTGKTYGALTIERALNFVRG